MMENITLNNINPTNLLQVDMQFQRAVILGLAGAYVYPERLDKQQLSAYVMDSWTEKPLRVWV